MVYSLTFIICYMDSVRYKLLCIAASFTEKNKLKVFTSRWPDTSDSRMADHGISWATLTSFWLPLMLRYLKQRLSHKSSIWRQIMHFLCCQNFLGAHRNVIYSFARSNGNFFSVYFCVCIPKTTNFGCMSGHGKPPLFFSVYFCVCIPKTTDFGCMSGHGKPPLCQRLLPFRKVLK